VPARSTDESPRCRSCGAALVVGAPVCATCGEPTGPPERKLVTLLFADLTGYTELCNRLDPEDVHDFVRPAMTALRRVVESFGGSVPQVLGDGFMAVFGAPVGHEDDAARAMHAAVAVHAEVAAINRTSDRLRIPAVHIGVNTGEVFVAASREASGFSVAGDPVNLAARLCALAEAGQTLVGERTAELAGAGVRLGPGRRREVRGFAELVAVHEVLGLDAGVSAAREDGAAFVGRTHALARLHVALDETVAARTSRALLLTGEAGQGKTRLAAEFLARRAGITVLRGRCTPYGRRRPLQAAVDAVAGYLGVAAGAPARLVADAARRTFAASATPSLVAQAVSFVGPLGDRQPDDSDGAAADLAALRSVLAAVAAAQPAVLLLDDLHWADDELRAAVCDLHNAPLRAPLLVLCLTRPDGAVGCPLPEHVLGALPDDDMRKLLVDLLGTEPPGWLATDLLARAGGNPLFLEECTRMLLETGGISRVGDGVDADRALLRRVPNSMRMFIAARLDGLSPAEKRLLQRASVAGDTFWTGLLQEMSGEPEAELSTVLASLVDRGLLRHEPRGSVTGQDQYVFKHVLIRDVAYDSLARRDRSALHRVVGTWLTELSADGGPAAPLGLLAYHFHQAFALARSDTTSAQPSCELARLAVRHLLAWGRSLYRYQAREAETALSQALDVAQAARQCISDDVYATLLVERARALNELLRFGEAIDDLRTAQELADAVGDDRLRADALLAHSLALSHLSRLDRARELHAEAAALLDRAGDRRALAAATFQAAENLRYDDLPAMTRLLREAYDLYGAAGDDGGQAMVARYLSYLLSPAGGPEFRRWYDLADASARDEYELRGRASVRCSLAYHQQYRGDLVQALDTARLARQDAAEAGARWHEMDGLLIQQECLSALGRAEESDRVQADILARADALGARRLRAVAILNGSRSAARSRRTTVAWQQLREARAVLDEIGERTAELGVFIYEAELLMDGGRWAEASAVAERAVDRAESNGWSLAATLPRLVNARSAVADRDGRAERLVVEALDAVRRHDAPRYGALAAACLEQHQLLLGDVRSATLAPSLTDLAETHATAAENDGLRLLRAGSFAEAAAAFGRAAQAWEPLGATVWLARALLWQAEALRRTGDEAGAVAVEEPLPGLLRDLDVPEGLVAQLRTTLP
jgi:class 3 adenylate cyclase